jgi:hypothetical protein
VIALFALLGSCAETRASSATRSTTTNGGCHTGGRSSVESDYAWPGMTRHRSHWWNWTDCLWALSEANSKQNLQLDCGNLGIILRGHVDGRAHGVARRLAVSALSTSLRGQHVSV